MRLGRVMGRVVSTVRIAGLEGTTLLWVQPLDAGLAPQGDAVVACDTAQSGPGDVVSWVGGREAAMALAHSFVPVDATIVGHVEPASGLHPEEP